MGAACEGDRFDGAPEPPHLDLRAYGHLLLCDTTEDLYRAGVPAGAGLLVVLRHTPGEGDLSLTVTMGGAADIVLGESDWRSGVEAVGLDPVAIDRAVDLLVRGRPGTSVPYSISLERQPPDVCLPDTLEGPLGNDDQAHALRLLPGLHLVRICPGDEDWFSLDLAAGDELVVRAASEAVPEDLGLTLLGPDGQEVAAGASDGRAQVLATPIAAAGVHLLRLYGVRADVRDAVTLSITVGD